MTTTDIAIATLLKIAFILGIAFAAALILIWAERRQSAKIQDRVGPTRADITIFGRRITLWGLLHPFADALKFLFKEDFVPPRADKLLHAAAPLLTVVTAVAAFAVIPFADTLYPRFAGEVLPQDGMIRGPVIHMQVASLSVGILFLFAVAGTGVAGAAIAGYASDNKYSLLGGLRAASQMVGYEVALGLTLIGSFMVYGTLLPEEMVRWQADHGLWGILVQPVAFILFFAAATAENKRIPFDVPEGESEIVGGYFTEYSGMKFGMFFLGEFFELVLLAAVLTTVFFGGYDLPGLERNGFEGFGWVLPLSHWVVIALQALTFVVKLALLIWFQLMVRWTLPRFRYDQIMKLCWKYLLPLALVNIMVTGIVILLIGG